MREYQPFPISNFRGGFNESVEPWLNPRDSFQQLINAHLYRGVVERIDGYKLFADFTYRNIMSLGTPDGVTATFTVTLSSLPVTTNFYAYGTISAGSSAETFSYANDASATVINLMGNAGGTGTVNIATGAVSITFNTAPPSDTYSDIFIIWDSAPSSITAVMGIKQYFKNDGSQDVLVFDQKRVGKIIDIFGALGAQATVLQAVTELPHDYYDAGVITGDGSTTEFTDTFSGFPFVPGTLMLTEYNSVGVATGRVLIDNGTGGITGTDVDTGEVNYVTGAYTITFDPAPDNGNYFDATLGVYGDIFNGTISNFISLVNYQYKAFFTNNNDPIYYYDGISVHYLNTNLEAKVVQAASGKPSNFDITKCLHVTVNQARLLLVAPLVESILLVSTIYWSRAFFPLDFTNDEFLEAPTSQPIRAFGFINTDMIVRFATSERVFRYTADAFSPFRWDSTNNLWACDAPYSAINYDSWFSSIGRPAIVGSDGVNVKRVDDLIPDFTDPTRVIDQTPVPYINQTSIQQCYGERFDDLKEGWLCYNSALSNEGSATASTNVLAFNYLDGTYSIYTFPFSCLGYGRRTNIPTWGTTYTNWEDGTDTWDSYALQNQALLDLGGDQFDKVYELNNGNTLGDGETQVLMSAITKNFNPFIEQGQLCRFGYLDLFLTASPNTFLRVQFFLNDQLYVDGNGNPAGFYQESIIDLTPTDAMSPITLQTKIWKRIYVGSTGKSHTIRFYQNEVDYPTGFESQPIYMHSFVLNMKPAGRIFN